MRRSWAVPVAMCALFLAACSSSDSGGTDAARTTRPAATDEPTTTSAPTTTPEPLDDQAGPKSINGITVQGDTLWVASINDDQVVQIDRSTGAILQRFDTKGAGPDDVAVGPDGAVYTAGFGNGDLGRIADGRYEVVSNVAPAINPIEFAPDGTLYVGTYGPKGTLYEVPLDGTKAKVVARDLPDINAFGILADGTILAPSGGVTGPGAVVRIDPGTGKTTTVVGGLDPVAAGATDASGTFFVLANITGDVLEVDVDAGTAQRYKLVPDGAPFDNLAFADDGTLYLSSFGSPSITVVTAEGDVSTMPVGA